MSARLEDAWTIPVDLSLGMGEPVLPVAEPWSMARAQLEQVLPSLLEKARRSFLNEDACADHAPRRADPPAASPDRRTARDEA